MRCRCYPSAFQMPFRVSNTDVNIDNHSSRSIIVVYRSLFEPNIPPQNLCSGLMGDITNVCRVVVLSPGQHDEYSFMADQGLVLYTAKQNVIERSMCDPILVTAEAGLNGITVTDRELAECRD